MPILIFLYVFYGFRVRSPYGTDRRTDGRPRRVMRPLGRRRNNCFDKMRADGISANAHSSAAGCTAAKDSVDRTNYSDTFAHTPERRDSNVRTAVGDSLAPTICRNTPALTWRRLANATILNYSTTPLRGTACAARITRISRAEMLTSRCLQSRILRI